MRLKTSVVLAILVLCGRTSTAATRQAASCSRADVLTAIASASTGDTVLIPAGTCTWTTNVTLDKAITLQGAGMDQTVLIDGVSKGGYPNVPQLLAWNLQATGFHRLTGMTFDGGTGERDIYNKGIVQITGRSTPNFRMDHVRVITRRTAGVMFYDVLGVVDHCQIDMTNWSFGFYAFNPSWKGVGEFGDNSWAQPTNFGSDQFLFVEDTTFNSVEVSTMYSVDGWSGARVVYRHNRFVNTAWSNHGTESGGRLRGMRAFEVYENDFVFDDARAVTPTVQGSRGGVGVVWNNRLTITNGAFVTRFADITYYRAAQSYEPWGMCDGTSPWDQNVAGQSGWRCLDQTGVGPGVLLSGAAPTPAWPSQVAEPSYYWNNTRNGVQSPPLPNHAVIKEGRDYYTTAMPGYVPYTYPHPLASGVSPTPPGSPTNLRVVP